MKTIRRALVQSVYLLTGPLTAAAGLLLVLAGLCVAGAGLLVRRGSAFVPIALLPARWFGDVERWRIARVRTPAAKVGLPNGQDSGRGTDRPGGPVGSNGSVGAGRTSPARARPTASDPGVWLEVAHALVVLPVALTTAVITFLWWFVGIGMGTSALRNPNPPATGSLPPMTLNAGSARSHIDVSLGLTSPSERFAFGTAAGLLLLIMLPLVTRACVTVQAGLGQALLSGTSALHRRISGLEQERDTARAQTVAAVSAEATALRRLERDLHDGPQQRLVRLAMELGRAQHQFDTRPELVREALAAAIVQTQETLDELRALSRGIAPPILVDRGLPAALTALAARCTVPTALDVPDPDLRMDAAVESAAYFVVAEALTNVAKHSQAQRCSIALRHAEGTLRIQVRDDGVGGAALAKGHGLRGLDDRLHAVGAQLRVTSPDGGPTTITADLPCA